jgi:hypothetical protein
VEELRVKIKLSFKDFLDFQYWYLRKKFLKKLIFFAALLFLIVILFFTILGGDFFLAAIPALAPLVIFILLVPLFVIISTYYAAKRSYTNDLQIQKEQEYFFDFSGLYFSTENSHTKLTWTELLKFEESKNNLLIYCSLTKCFIIPKNQLNEIEINEIRNLLTQNVASKIKSHSILPTPVRIAIYVIPISVVLILNFSSIKTIVTSKNSFNIFSKEHKGFYTDSITKYTSEIEKNLTNPLPYYHRAISKMHLKDYKGAMYDCSIAIHFNKNFSEAFYCRGKAKRLLKNYDGACDDFYEASGLGLAVADKAIEKNCD